MARYAFGDGPGDFVIVAGVGLTPVLLVGAVGTVWTAKTGGTQLTDLIAADGTTHVTNLTSDSDARIAFHGPDGVTECWVDFGHGRFLLETTDDTSGATPLDADLVAIADIDATTAGVLASDGAGWTLKSLAQLLHDLGAAPLDSPHLGGTPTVPTADGGTNTTQAASTAFTTAAIAAAALAGFRTVSGATDTFAFADARKTILWTGGGTETVPPNSSVAFPVGTSLRLTALGAAVTVAPGAGVTVDASRGYKTASQFSTLTLLKIGTDRWVLSGGTSAATSGFGTSPFGTTPFGS